MRFALISALFIQSSLDFLSHLQPRWTDRQFLQTDSQWKQQFWVSFIFNLYSYSYTNNLWSFHSQINSNNIDYWYLSWRFIIGDEIPVFHFRTFIIILIFLLLLLLWSNWNGSLRTCEPRTARPGECSSRLLQVCLALGEWYGHWKKENDW